MLARGSGTKRALSAPRDGVTPIEMLGLTGIVDYDPEEFTITALAGTPLAQLETSLAEHG